jgi:hypothetical protein
MTDERNRITASFGNGDDDWKSATGQPLMDVPELLRRAADLVPPSASSDAGLGGDAVRDYLRANEWEVALGILMDFDGIQWQTMKFWDLLCDAARHMGLDRDAAWCRWRRRETLHGLIRADLQLLAPHNGGRRTPIPGTGQLRPMWAIGHNGAETGTGLNVAVIWVESALEIRPGGRGSIRLAPLTPADWRHLRLGDVITMHERQPVSGTATITEIRHPTPPC